MDAPWPCSLCERIFTIATELAAHLNLWHEEWLIGNRIPPALHPAPISEF
jgi:hypothetical protein